MSGQWKPGDVALVRISAEFPPEVAVSGDRQWFVAGPRLGSQHGWYHDRVEVIRPLVVIDPEDREEIERLHAALVSSVSWGATGADLHDRDASREAWVVAMQAALREFANPTPPKPEEPTGLGAVVADVHGDYWVYTGLREDVYGEKRRWFHGERDSFYADINAVEVLSEGVTP